MVASRPRLASGATSRRVLYVALAGNLAIAVTKFTAAAFTGSAAMLSEGVHSLVDTGNEVLLLYGSYRSQLPPDAEHPLGYGRELYFWSFVVAVLIFALGAVVSMYEGVDHIIHPEPIGNLGWAYGVLAVSALFEGASWSVALRDMRRRKGREGYIAAARRSKDPTTFTVLFEDSAALLGLLFAFVGIALAHGLDMPRFDGAASLAIGAVLAGTALFLGRESKALLIGERAHLHVDEEIRRVAENDPAVVGVNGVFSMQLGPHEVAVLLSAEFADALTLPDLEACIERIEERIRTARPEVSRVFVKPQTPAMWRRRDSIDGY